VTLARGTFEVKTTPRVPDGEPEALGRMSLDKVYRGDLEGTGRGEMLTAMSGVEGSGAYVAVEVVRGALRGRRGSFALQHRGVMTRGAPELAIAIVPDSGTEGLAGISGRLGIEIRDGKHFYELEYELPSEK
jgi:hypothetical protein